MIDFEAKTVLSPIVITAFWAVVVKKGEGIMVLRRR